MGPIELGLDARRELFSTRFNGAWRVGGGGRGNIQFFSSSTSLPVPDEIYDGRE